MAWKRAEHARALQNKTEVFSVDDHYYILQIQVSMQSPVIHIRTPKKSGEDGGTLTSTHLLPCKVKCVCDGEEEVTCSHPAKVDEFFDPVIRTVGSEGEETRTRALGEEYSATFRGRPLRGVLVKIPDGFTGQVLHEHGAASFTEEVKDSLKAMHYVSTLLLYL